MTMMEKIKFLNAGVNLGKQVNSKKIHTRIYCGTEDELMLFRRIIAALGLNVEYEVEDVDGEIEVVVKEVSL